MSILVINCGSSSAKYELFDLKKHKSIVKGIVERITKNSDYGKAIKTIRDRLVKAKHLKSGWELKGIGHRVVHGGEKFRGSTLISKKTVKQIDGFSKLAPLHNPPSVAGIKACFKIFKGVPQVAVFDTSFHQSMPEHSYIYGIPYGFYKKYDIRRYGFHGTSHRYVSMKASEVLKKPLSKLKLITVHLGNGCSMAAVKSGRSVDTTMGLTPLEGLLMGTRSGDIDPAIVLYLMETLKKTPAQVEDILNKKSGLLGISGISNDMRDILRAVRSGNNRAKLALDIFIYRIKKYVGAYAAVMSGLDAVIFTGGIGEHVPRIKNHIAKALKGVYSKKVKFLIIPTYEELLIAGDTYKLVK